MKKPKLVKHEYRRANPKHKTARRTKAGPRGQLATPRRKAPGSRIRDNKLTRNDTASQTKTNRARIAKRASNPSVKLKRTIVKSSKKTSGKVIPKRKAVAKRAAVVKRILPTKFKKVAPKKKLIVKTIPKKPIVKAIPKKPIVKTIPKKPIVKAIPKKPKKKSVTKPKSIIPAKGIEARLAALEEQASISRKREKELEDKLAQAEAKLKKSEELRTIASKRIEQAEIALDKTKAPAKLKLKLEEMLGPDVELEQIIGIPMRSKDEWREYVRELGASKPDMIAAIDALREGGTALTPEIENTLMELAYEYDQSPTEVFTIFISG